MQPKSVLEALDEELTHVSPIARNGDANSFRLFAIIHRVAGVGDIQCFWPLAYVGRGIRASVMDQSGDQTIVFRYRAVRHYYQRTVDLTMEDGSLRTAALRNSTMDVYEIMYNFRYIQNDHGVVSALMIESAIRAGDLARLKGMVKTANHLSMGFGSRPIHMAMLYNQPHILEWLVAQPGIDVNRIPVYSTSTNAEWLFRPSGTEAKDALFMRDLCTLLRAGMTLMEQDPTTGFHIFHLLAQTSASNVILVTGQEDIAQKLLNYAACAFEPNAKVERPAELYASASPPFAAFLARLIETLRCVVGIHVPVSALAGIVVSYITS